MINYYLKYLFVCFAILLVNQVYSQTTTYYTISDVNKSVKQGELPTFSWSEDGITISSDYYIGKVLLVNLWATWCGPCVKEIPDLSELYTESKDDGLEILGIQIWKNPDAMSLEKFLKKYDVSYKILDGNDDIVDVFQKCINQEIQGIPTTIIFNREGKMKEVLVGSRKKSDFKKLISKYL